MKKISVYLDNCCFNRPFDDLSVSKVQLEAEAKLFIQAQIKKGELALIWSFILDYENNENPYEDIAEQIREWKSLAVSYVRPTEEIRRSAEDLGSKYNLKAKDSLHLAAAIAGEADYFISTDRKFIRNVSSIQNIRCINPLDWFGEAEND